MKLPRIVVLTSAIALSSVLAGCGGGGGGGGGGGTPPPGDLPPIPGEMMSSNFHLETGAVAWGGGASSGSGKVCFGTVLVPEGNASSLPPAAEYHLQAGYQNVTNSRAN